jgi:hypothetical protein
MIAISGILAASCIKVAKNEQYGDSPKYHSLETELKLLYDVSKLPEYLDSTLVAQVSTYDTTGGNDDGFSGKYSYLSRNADSSLVIFDVKGGGVINRFWTPTPTNDTLDFYLDGSSRAALSIRYIDLFSGTVFPFIKPLCGNQLGGYFCYFPIPFEKSCKIIFRGKKIQFHQIQYRLYAKGSRVKSFVPDLLNEEKEVLNKVALLWNKENRSVGDFIDTISVELLNISKSIEIKPGETKNIFTLNEGGRIVGIECEPAGIFEGLDKQIDIKMTWDNEMVPAIYCPVADFFGYAFGTKSMQSLLIGSQNNRNYCFLPMPFDKSAKIDLIYRKTPHESQGKILKIKSKIFYNTDKRKIQSEGKLYAFRNRNMNSEKGKSHVFLDVNGKGHLVGAILQAQGLKPGMTIFFEGDDSTAIDGTMRLHGTGSEDYFNGGWYAFMDCWDSKISLPLHGSLDYSLPLCRTGGYRFYLPDKISFEKSLFHSIEHGPIGNQFPVDYTSLAFYYSDSPISNITNPTNELSKVYIPDTLVIYPQLMAYNIWEGFACKSVWAYNTGGMSFIFTIGDDSKIRISLTDIPHGKYDLYADFEKNKSGCEFSLWQRQTQISEWVSTNNPEKERVAKLFLSGLEIDEFMNTITLKFKTSQLNNTFFLNRLILIKKSLK